MYCLFFDLQALKAMFLLFIHLICYLFLVPHSCILSTWIVATFALYSTDTSIVLYVVGCGITFCSQVLYLIRSIELFVWSLTLRLTLCNRLLCRCHASISTAVLQWSWHNLYVCMCVCTPTFLLPSSRNIKLEKSGCSLQVRASLKIYSF